MQSLITVDYLKFHWQHHIRVICLPKYIFQHTPLIYFPRAKVMELEYLEDVHLFFFFLFYLLFYSKSSSSSSYRAGSTDIPDPLSPLLPIVHRPR